MFPRRSFQSPFGSVPDAVTMKGVAHLCVVFRFLPLSWVVYKESFVWFPCFSWRDVRHPCVVHAECALLIQDIRCECFSFLNNYDAPLYAQSAVGVVVTCLPSTQTLWVRFPDGALPIEGKLKLNKDI